MGIAWVGAAKEGMARRVRRRSTNADTFIVDCVCVCGCV